MERLPRAKLISQLDKTARVAGKRVVPRVYVLEIGHGTQERRDDPRQEIELNVQTDQVRQRSDGSWQVPSQAVVVHAKHLQSTHTTHSRRDSPPEVVALQLQAHQRRQLTESVRQSTVHAVS